MTIVLAPKHGVTASTQPETISPYPQCVLPSGFLLAGNRHKVLAQGHVNALGDPFEIGVYFGQLSRLGLLSGVKLHDGVLDTCWTLGLEFEVTKTGPQGKAKVAGTLHVGTLDPIVMDACVVTIDTTVASWVVVRAAWGVACAGNTICCDSFSWRSDRDLFESVAPHLSGTGRVVKRESLAPVQACTECQLDDLPLAEVAPGRHLCHFCAELQSVTAANTTSRQVGRSRSAALHYASLVSLVCAWTLIAALVLIGPSWLLAGPLQVAALACGVWVIVSARSVTDGPFTRRRK